MTLTSKLDVSARGVRSGSAKQNFASHCEIGLLIIMQRVHYNKQEYRSGHNEAVLKTVCPKGTGVRIPLPAPNKRTTEPTKLGCFLFLWHWYERILTPLCDSPSRRMGFAFERKPSVSSLTSGGAKNLRQRRIPRNERQC